MTSSRDRSNGSSLTRREFGALALGGAAVLQLGVAGLAGSALAMPDDGSVLLTVDGNRDMRWHQHLGPMGAATFATESDSKVGNGWSFPTLVAGEDGVVFGVQPDGKLRWYQYIGEQGQRRWAPGSGNEVGHGWAQFSHLVHGGNNVLYAVRPDGDLLWYQYTGTAGEWSWRAGAGTKIGHGFRFRQMVGGGDGTLYCVNDENDLMWYRDLARDGTRQWANGGRGLKVGHGWNFAALTSPGDGSIYALSAAGDLRWYQDVSRKGVFQWHPDSSAVIAQSFEADQLVAVFHDVPVEGGPDNPPDTPIETYLWPLRVRPGQQVSLHSTSSAATFDASLYLLGSATSTATSPGALIDRAIVGRESMFQPIPAEAWKDGCDWSPTGSITIPAGAESGIYGVESVDSEGRRSWSSFVVQPASTDRARTADRFAVLANVNTWNAYNSWGGRGKYSRPVVGNPLSLLRPSLNDSPMDPTPARQAVGNPENATNAYNHLVLAELWGHRWLRSEGIEFDVFTDMDLHDGTLDVAAYKGLILLVHPEYWSVEMYDRTEAALRTSDTSLIYLGGNGVYESMTYPTPEMDHTAFLGGLDPSDPNAARGNWLMRAPAIGRPEAGLLGVAYDAENYVTYAPYEVLKPDHPFFAGTDLRQGDQFGTEGLMGAASGWEMDATNTSSPAGIEILARGMNQSAAGNHAAEMTFYETSGGGFVFSVGSLTYVGALASDPALAQITRNVLSAASG